MSHKHGGTFTLLAIAAVGLLVPMAATASASTGAHATKAPVAAKPTVTSMSVHHGNRTGGARVIVHGTHFTHARRVTFSGVPGTHLHVVSPHKLVVTAPAHYASQVNVRVINAGGYSPITTHDEFRYQVITTLAGAYRSSCQTVDGLVRCWGDNTDGQLGNGTYTTAKTPTTVLGLSDIVSVASGYDQVCALNGAGQVSCWGANQHGQLGNGTYTFEAKPVRVRGLSPALEIVAGGGSTCALVVGNHLECWGENQDGQLGDGTLTNNPLPSVVPGNHVVDVAAGAVTTCAVHLVGTVYCWGDNTYGQLGVGSAGDVLPNATRPVLVSKVTNAVTVSAGVTSECITTTKHLADCWGDGTDGVLGDGSMSERTSPTKVANLADVSRLVMGGYQSCAITGGADQCWGEDDAGELGGGMMSNSDIPTRVANLTHVTDIGAGTYHSLAVTSSGIVYAWGDNTYDQLGECSATTATKPVRVV